MSRSGALLVVVILSACASIGVPIDEAACARSIGWTEAQLRERFGVPHAAGADSEGFKTLTWGTEEHVLFDARSGGQVEFRLRDGVVVGWRRSEWRLVADKNDSR